MPGTSHETIMQNLERRFDAIAQEKVSYRFIAAERDYIDYLDREATLHPIIADLINDGRMSDDVMVHMVSVFNGYRSQEEPGGQVKLPRFMSTKGLERRYVLAQIHSWQYIQEEEKRRQTHEMQMASIRTFGHDDLSSRLSQAMFDGELSMLRKLHNDIMERLSYGITASRPRFDADKSVLYVQDRPVIVKKFSDQYHLLNIVFGDPTRVSDEWFFSEIAERIDDSGTVNEDKKYYNAAYQIAQKVAKDAQVRGFFVLTKQSLKIDPGHLA